MTRNTRLALQGIDSAPDASVELRFAARGETFSWRFKAATYDELVALVLGGRLGAGKDVHFDAARVSFQKPAEGRPETVTVSIGRKVRIVAPVPRRNGKTTRPPADAQVVRPAQRRTRSRRKSPAA